MLSNVAIIVAYEANLQREKFPCDLGLSCDEKVHLACRYRASWLMEDWMAFAETFSLFLLHDLPWTDDDDPEVREVFEELWRDLRHGIMYFMRFDEGQHNQERILQAQKSLINYGKRAEEVCCYTH